MRRAVLAVALASACSAEGPATPPPATPSDGGVGAAPDAAAPDAAAGPAVTYYRDTKPIFDAKCVSCHGAGAIGPFPLGTYAEVAPVRVPIGLAVEERRMPPWHADRSCESFSNDRSLTDAQRDTILEWVRVGGPEGDPRDEPAALPPSDPGLTRIDQRLPVEGEYTPHGADDYRCFVLEWPEVADKYVTGFNLLPSNAAIVHHANIYAIGPAQAQAFRAKQSADGVPGYACYGGVFATGTTLLGSWAPGSHGLELPGGAGILVEPGSVIVAEMHFNTDSARGSDRSTLAFKVDSEVRRRALILPFWNFFDWSMGGGMLIPRDATDVMHQYEFDPAPARNILAPWIGEDQVQILGVGMHMHQLGKSGRLEIRRAGEGAQCMLDIPRWDFSWQSSYFFEEPVPFTMGADRLFLECHFDNSDANQPIVNGAKAASRDVRWGEDSRDEMCIGYALIVEQ